MCMDSYPTPWFPLSYAAQQKTGCAAHNKNQA